MRATALRLSRSFVFVCSLGAAASPGACGDDASGGPAQSSLSNGDAATADAPQPHMPGQDAGACAVAPDCQDLVTSFFEYPACCSPHVMCGYEITYDDEFLEVYPQARDVLINLAADDPEGKCVPESFVFPERPGTYDHRVELDGSEEGDILIAEQCESRGLLVFTLPGCCMPNDQCGISTDEVAGTLEVLLDGAAAPFTKPECVSADELNAQLLETSLSAFARIPATSGAACDRAALAQTIPRYRQPGR